jgi:hypothetical protein
MDLGAVAVHGRKAASLLAGSTNRARRDKFRIFAQSRRAVIAASAKLPIVSEWRRSYRRNTHYCDSVVEWNYTIKPRRS